MELASTAREHDNGDLGIAENGELIGLLEEAVSSFRVSNLAIGGVLYPLDLDLTSSHLSPLGTLDFSEELSRKTKQKLSKEKSKKRKIERRGREEGEKEMCCLKRKALCQIGESFCRLC